MATANNTIKTRIQLKSDTEVNWNKAGPKQGSAGFVPLQGELIVYVPDATHPFSRLKIGDGITNVVELPFADAGTINGEEVEIVKKNTKSEFPLSGSTDKLYIDLTTNSIYHYTGANGYSQLSNFTYRPVKTTIRNITYWGAGRAATASVNNNILQLTNGVAPSLLTNSLDVMTDIQKEANNE